MGRGGQSPRRGTRGGVEPPRRDSHGATTSRSPGERGRNPAGDPRRRRRPGPPRASGPAGRAALTWLRARGRPGRARAPLARRDRERRTKGEGRGARIRCGLPPTPRSSGRGWERGAPGAGGRSLSHAGVAVRAEPEAAGVRPGEAVAERRAEAAGRGGATGSATRSPGSTCGRAGPGRARGAAASLSLRGTFRPPIVASQPRAARKGKFSLAAPGLLWGSGWKKPPVRGGGSLSGWWLTPCRPAPGN